MTHDILNNDVVIKCQKVDIMLHFSHILHSSAQNHAHKLFFSILRKNWDVISWKLFSCNWTWYAFLHIFFLSALFRIQKKISGEPREKYIRFVFFIETLKWMEYEILEHNHQARSCSQEVYKKNSYKKISTRLHSQLAPFSFYTKNRPSLLIKMEHSRRYPVFFKGTWVNKEVEENFLLRKKRFFFSQKNLFLIWHFVCVLCSGTLLRNLVT